MLGRLRIGLILCCAYSLTVLFVAWLFFMTGDVFCAPIAVFHGSTKMMAKCLNETQQSTKTIQTDNYDIADIIGDDDDLANGTSLIAVYIRCDPQKSHRWVSIEKIWSDVLQRYSIQLFFVVGRTAWPIFRPEVRNVLVLDFVDDSNALTEKMNGIFAHFINLAKQPGRRRGQKVAIMLNDNIIVYPEKVVDSIDQMVPKNSMRPFIGGRIAKRGKWNVTCLLKTWYKPEIFGEFISGYAVIVNLQAATLFYNALGRFPVAYRKRFRLDDILITWFLADSLNIQRIDTTVIGDCTTSKSDGSISWNQSLAIVHCWQIEGDAIDRVLDRQALGGQNESEYVSKVLN